MRTGFERIAGSDPGRRSGLNMDKYLHLGCCQGGKIGVEQLVRQGNFPGARDGAEFPAVTERSAQMARS